MIEMKPCLLRLEKLCHPLACRTCSGHSLRSSAPNAFVCSLADILSQSMSAVEQVRAELYKLSSLSLCSNTIGQLATGIMINPPKPGDPSFETFEKVNTKRGVS